GGRAAVIPGAKKAYYLVRTPVYRARRRRWPQVLEEEFGITAPVHYFHHHYCHATGAYFTSGFDRALVVTVDGGGDRSSSHVYHAVDGKLTLLSTVDSYDSLGNYYAYITAICGYKAKKHEGKITGLAAHGEPRYYDDLAKLIQYRDGRFVNTGRVLFNQALSKIREFLPPDWKKEDLAASIQRLAEDHCRSYVRYWLEATGETNVSLSGGVFANVRINQEINELPQVENVLVHPGMGDEGLGVGAAMAVWGEKAMANGSHPFTNQPVLRDVYFGPDYSEEEMLAALKESGLEYERVDNIEAAIARLLVEGYVVARFDGPMEYGPRALGSRSILYHPTDAAVNDWLNKRLVRTEFMPFAPATLFEEADRCYENMRGGVETARFMTITFNCTPWMREHCPAVVHIDGTARPQLVREEENPSYYGIIREFYELTGLPSIINTSFNMHGEPIVCSPEDAIRSFTNGHLDYLAMGPFLIPNPTGIDRQLTPCKTLKPVAQTTR
ncbi:MAG: carbamoyltransferase C-terminal domain-containing protein, partial [Chloroflexota bacterium]